MCIVHCNNKIALKVASNTMGGNFFCQIQARQSAMSVQQLPSSQERYPITPINTYPMPALQQPPQQREVFQTYQQQSYRQQQGMAPIYYPTQNVKNVVSQTNQDSIFPIYNGANQFQPSQPYYQGQQGFQPMFQPSPTFQPSPMQVCLD